MSAETILTNARVVTLDAEFDGTVVIRDGRIVEVNTGRSCAAGATDLEGDYLVPGLVELHTDNLEKHFAPRPGVKWPSVPAMMAHDTQVAAAGITTVFDSLALGDVRGETDRVRNKERMIEAICMTSDKRMTRADHRLHLRCEIIADDAVETVDKWIDLPLVGLVSINDHTPGQRQFLDPEKLRLYHTKKYGMTNDEFDVFKAQTIALHAKNAVRHRNEIVARAQARALPIASHDDATHEHVREAVQNGMTIAEFPTTAEAAHASREAGLSVLVGAPNVVLGGSHSGNIAAIDLIRGGHAGHPVVGLCTGQPDGRRVQAAAVRRRHLAVAGCALCLVQSRARRRPRRSRRDRCRSPRRPGAGACARGRADRAFGVARGQPRCLTSTDRWSTSWARPARARTPCSIGPACCCRTMCRWCSPIATSRARPRRAARTISSSARRSSPCAAPTASSPSTGAHTATNTASAARSMPGARRV
jgi:alpha-D-ribose 1-methylphosphonate 5-triphosphate diphosphatase